MGKPTLKGGVEEAELTLDDWVLYLPGRADMESRKVLVDVALGGEFSGYPQTEWERYGQLPPSGYDVYAGWRRRDKFFVFLLLQENEMASSSAMLYLVGYTNDIIALGNKLTGVKNTILNWEQDAIELEELDELIAHITQKRTLGILGATVVSASTCAGVALRLATGGGVLNGLQGICRTTAATALGLFATISVVLACGATWLGILFGLRALGIQYARIRLRRRLGLQSGRK